MQDGSEEEQERWEQIPGWPYRVSSFGRIQRTESRTNTTCGYILNPRPVRGYPSVTLCCSGVRKTFAVHRLVCAAFHGPKPTPRHQAAHRNGVRDDNRASNLYWATAEENERDKVWHGRARGSNNHRAKLTEADVAAIHALVATGRFTKLQIAALFRVSDGLIGHIVHGRNWTHVE